MDSIPNIPELEAIVQVTHEIGILRGQVQTLTKQFEAAQDKIIQYEGHAVRQAILIGDLKQQIRKYKKTSTKKETC